MQVQEGTQSYVALGVFQNICFFSFFHVQSFN